MIRKIVLKTDEIAQAVMDKAGVPPESPCNVHFVIERGTLTAEVTYDEFPSHFKIERILRRVK